MKDLIVFQIILKSIRYFSTRNEICLIVICNKLWIFQKFLIIIFFFSNSKIQIFITEMVALVSREFAKKKINQFHNIITKLWKFKYFSLKNSIQNTAIIFMNYFENRWIYEKISFERNVENWILHKNPYFVFFSNFQKSCRAGCLFGRRRSRAR